jgi:hypothetical protein
VNRMKARILITLVMLALAVAAVGGGFHSGH